MVTCRKCNCRCDPGDLVGGICDDCREEEKMLEIKREQRRMMFAMNLAEQEDGQIVLCR